MSSASGTASEAAAVAVASTASAKADRLSLEVIIGKFSSPLTEEHAWAIVYEALKCLENLLRTYSVRFGGASGQQGSLGKKRSQGSGPSSSSSSHGPNGGQPTSTGGSWTKDIHLVSATKEIFIDFDGRVHESTFLDPVLINPDGITIARQPASSIEKAVAELAVVIYTALDFGLNDGEERNLSPGLENLLDLMTSIDPSRRSNETSDNDCNETDDDPDDDEEDGDEHDDEGIDCADDTAMDHLRSLEPSPDHSLAGGMVHGPQRGQTSSSFQGGPHTRPHHTRQLSEEGNSTSSTLSGHGKKDSGCGSIISLDTLRRVRDLCEHHLSVGSEAEEHYRKVCRALVSESVELALFLEKAQKQEELHNEELVKLAQKDWAHLWIVTMNELRTGVKLKKTDFSKTPIEYALTPYEMLMDDIRSKRYKLRQVMIDGAIPPKVKKDAHDVILDFIRSRPPLRPVADRKLNPIKRGFSTPQELLMISIRDNAAKEDFLKRVDKPITPKLSMPDDWSSSSIFEKSLRRGSDESTTSTVQTTIAEEEGFDDASAPSGQTGGNFQRQSKVVVIRKKQRKPAARSYSMLADQRQRPLSMSCVQIHPSPSSNHPTTPHTPVSGDQRKRILIKPDPSFLKGCSVNDPDLEDDSLSGDSNSLDSCHHDSTQLSGHQVRSARAGSVGANVFLSQADSYPQKATTPSSAKPMNHARSEWNLSGPSSGGNISRRSTSFLHSTQQQNTPLKPYYDPRVSDPLRTPSRSIQQQQQRSEAEILRSVSRRFSSLSVQELQYQHPAMARGSLRSHTLFHGGGPSEFYPQHVQQHRGSLHSRKRVAPGRRHGSAAYLSPAAANAAGLTKQHRRSSAKDLVGYKSTPARRYSSSTALVQLDAIRRMSPPTLFDRSSNTNSLNKLTPQSVNSSSRTMPRPSSTSTPISTVPELSHCGSSSATTAGGGGRKTLNLSHEEVSHIRSVLVKAKTEALPLPPELKSDLESGKTCFVCMKVKFGFFFSRPYTCKFCRHYVCSSCIIKLKVSDDHFLNVPVGFLSPTLKQQQQRMGSFNSTADQQLGRNNNSLQQVQTAAGKGEKQQQRKSTGISGLWTTLSGAATGGSRKSSDESQKALEERKLSNSSNPEAEAASYSLPQHQQMTAADSSKSLPRTVKLKRSNTISANNNQASGGGGGGAHFGNSPGMNFHPQQAAHAVMAQKWMAQTIGSNPQQPGSAAPSPNQDRLPSYSVCLECKAVIENITAHRTAQLRRQAVSASRGHHGSGNCPPAVVNRHHRQGVVPPSPPVFTE